MSQISYNPLHIYIAKQSLLGMLSGEIYWGQSPIHEDIIL